MWPFWGDSEPTGRSRSPKDHFRCPHSRDLKPFSRLVFLQVLQRASTVRHSQPVTTPTSRSQSPVHHNFIDGAWVPSDSGRVFENRNPANCDDLIGRFQQSTREDVLRAIEAARRAYGPW